MSIEAVDGRSYGPRPYRVCREKVAEFVSVTGDDAQRWTDTAPPGFAAALLFVVAPDLLSDPVVDGAVVHGEQRFTWHRPLVVESDLTVTGTVERVRRRGGVAFVTFVLEVDDGDGLLIEGRSTFLVGPAAEPMEEVEPPPVYERASRHGASRADLVRYAAATRDWNPIHWDHASAVAAGLGSVVVHGLLQSSWLIQAAVSRPDLTLESARFRYTALLRPGQGAAVEGNPSPGEFDLRLRSGDNVTVTGSFKVRT